eukprot:3952621-Pyramimonas_sp.AAC.1
MSCLVVDYVLGLENDGLVRTGRSWKLYNCERRLFSSSEDESRVLLFSYPIFEISQGGRNCMTASPLGDSFSFSCVYVQLL